MMPPVPLAETVARERLKIAAGIRRLNGRLARQPLPRPEPPRSLLPQNQVERPAPADVLTCLAAVRQYVRIRAAGLFEGVGQHGEAGGVERAGGHVPLL